MDKWHVGENLAGDIRATATCFTRWQPAAAFLIDRMREYADQDDDFARSSAMLDDTTGYATLEEWVNSDDYPDMRAVDDAAASVRDIDRTTARIIASWWHSGMASPLYSFVSTGAIDAERMQDEINRDMAEQLDSGDRAALFGLIGYIKSADGLDDAGNRGPQDSWHEENRW